MGTLQNAGDEPDATGIQLRRGLLESRFTRDVYSTQYSGDSEWFLFAPCAGGLTVEVAGQEVTVLAPGAPLRKQLQGLKQGGQVKERRLTVKSVW